MLNVNREYFTDNIETYIHVTISSMETFNEWLENELKKRSWNQNQLAKRSGLAHGTISNILNNNKGFGPESLLAIARALKIPPETIFRAVGWLPESKDFTKDQELILHYYSLLDQDKKEIVIKLIESMLPE